MITVDKHTLHSPLSSAEIENRLSEAIENDAWDALAHFVDKTPGKPFVGIVKDGRYVLSLVQRGRINAMPTLVVSVEDRAGGSAVSLSVRANLSATLSGLFYGGISLVSCYFLFDKLTLSALGIPMTFFLFIAIGVWHLRREGRLAVSALASLLERSPDQDSLDLPGSADSADSSIQSK